MAGRHPHADATYRIVPQNDTTFGVEVAIPDAHPALVTSFATELAAEAWIADHKRKAEEGSTLKPRWARRAQRS